MKESAHKAVAIVGVGALLPDAPNALAFWQNVKDGRYSVTEVPRDRWDSDLYFDPDPKAPDKSYSKIGGWVRDWEWDPLKWRLPIPPKVSDSMDLTQKWAIIAAREALDDYGYPKRPLDPERTAVILGNAMGGDQHLYTAVRVLFPEYATELEKSNSFSELSPDMREKILREMREGVGKRFPDITEDTMPGELSNIIAGRIAAIFNFRGPNYVTDAACASAMAAISAAIEGLEENEYDVVVTGGIDANMSPQTYVKFCKIGALSATGTRPYAEGADGFVMGEGAAVLVIKRLSDAERDGDKIYAVIRSLGGSSDGKGKGITAPNPIGQRLAVQRAWQNAGLRPSPGDMIEGHGTSTRVGDVVEVQSLTEGLADCNLPSGSIALGSVKSNIGHLKGAAGAAGLLKATFALHEKMIPPSINFSRPNPGIDFGKTPFKVNTELQSWDGTPGGVRRAGVSSFGFGGTNFHAVMEEYIPGRITEERRSNAYFSKIDVTPGGGASLKAPPRGALLLGADSDASLAQKLAAVHRDAEAGKARAPSAPMASDLHAAVRLSIDYADASELADKTSQAIKAMEQNHQGRWKALRAKGIFLGRGPAPKVAFLFTGQGSQYVNMLRALRQSEPTVRDAFAEADRVMEPVLGKPLTDYIYQDESDEAAMKDAAEHLRQTAITQPAVLATETAIARLIGAYGVAPDMVMGHSLGEYGALVASGALPFDDALRAVSARGNAMTEASHGDNGLMAAVFGPIDEIDQIVNDVDGYVVIANINSTKEAVIGGATDAVEKAMAAVRDAGYVARQLQVSHAFHTEIVAPASESLAGTLRSMKMRSPDVPIIANVTGEFYPSGPGVEPQMIDILAKQVASPVQFVKGLRTLYGAGARVFVEMGPRRILYGFVEDVIGKNEDVLALFTNHPRIDESVAINQALCGLYASGLGSGDVRSDAAVETVVPHPERREAPPLRIVSSAPDVKPVSTPEQLPQPAPTDRYVQLGHLFAEFLDRGFEIYSGAKPSAVPAAVKEDSVACITGAAIGLPGVDGVFNDTNVERMLQGKQFIDAIPMEIRESMVERHITRLVKGKDGEARFETIDDTEDVIKLAARAQNLDLARDFGFPEDRLRALDVTTRLAIGAGIDAMRDAGIPLIQRYKTTTKGTKLPDRWVLPEDMQDDTGVIFASAFPGYNEFAKTVSSYYEDSARRQRVQDLEDLRAKLVKGNGGDGSLDEIDRRISALQVEIENNPFQFDRQFLFKVLSMGHSQFAEYIGARGPNTATNSACASGTQAVAIARDWIGRGRCRRVVIITADDITSDTLLQWFGSGFLASGAAATDEKVEDAAVPFDRRRHGLIIGMGGASLVVESEQSARERGIQPICQILNSVTANSGYHGSRLDINHICEVMEGLISKTEAEWGINRYEIAPQMVFVSHETYTPARGGSASAEVFALRHCFGEAADQIVVANTKGTTGHPMGVAIEDVVAVKILETGIVPPVANFREVDPELGRLNLSKGGEYPVRYALRLGAGFGSQISMTLSRWSPTADGRRRRPDELGYAYRIQKEEVWRDWLRRATGYDAPDLEVVHRTLRVKDEGPAERVERPAARMASAPSPQAKPAPVPAAMAATPPSASAPAGIKDPVQEKVLGIIAEQSGYPPDMLDVDLDLEADLGIDTVKQAEMFAAIRGAYDIPRDDNLKLRDFPTLAHAVQFVYDRRPDLKKPVAADVAVESVPPDRTDAPAAIPVAEDPVRIKVLELIAEKTGYPPDMLDLDLDLEADLGIDTVKQAEMFAAIRGAYDIPRDDDLKLREFPTLAHCIQFVYDRRPDLQGVVTPTSAAPVTPVEPPAPPAEDPVKVKVLEVIAEKTGYPPDMLDLDLDLEADLGIDTVKQAEMFAAIRGAYDIPRDDDLKLRDFPTLAHCIQFVYDRRPDLQPPGKETATMSSPPPVSAPVPSPAPSESQTAAPAGMESANQVPRRVPVPRLRPSLDLCKTTGVTLNGDSRVVVMADTGGVGKALVSRLERRGVEVLVIDDAPSSETLEARIDEWKAKGPIQGVYWLPALDDEGAISDMSSETWQESVRRRVKLLYTTMRLLYDSVGESGTFLVTATRLGGKHGYDSAGASAPLGGAVAGFTKSFKREKEGALCKVVDFEASRKKAPFADCLIGETLRDPGAVEIGYKDGYRWTVGLQEKIAGNGGVALSSESVFVVTGAAGSIVSAITSDLAMAAGGTFYLLDLAPKPDPANSDVRRFGSDKENLKRDIFDRLKSSGQRATPALVEKELSAIERQYSAQSAIDAVEKAGGVAHYYSVNLLDHDAVAEVMKNVSEKSGRIDVLLHAAGLEVSHLLPNKPQKEFDLVFDVKSDGWFNLMSNLGDMPLGAAVVFSSIAGRFGNAGQTDYSAANDLLCKSVSSFRSTRPDTRGIAIDWTAWGGIGMAVRGSIPSIMKQAGIDMLPPEAGVPVVRRELLGDGGEVVIAQSLGIMLKEFDPNGGLAVGDGGALDALMKSRGIMTGHIVGMSLHDGLTIETTLDPATQPFLYDHQIDGTAVLPGVMGLEALVEAAKLLFPDCHLGAIESVDFSSPFKFYRGQPRTVTVHADFSIDGKDIVADCRLVGSRELHGRSEPEVTTHFTARVRLVKEKPRAVKRKRLSEPAAGEKVASQDIYQLYFHGPAYQVVEDSWRSGDECVGLFAKDLPANHEPADRVTLASPRLVELCFQTAGISELSEKGTMGLPYHIDRVEFLRLPDTAKGRLLATVTSAASGGFDGQVIDESGNVYLKLWGYRTMSLPGSVDAELLKPLAAVHMPAGARGASLDDSGTRPEVRT